MFVRLTICGVLAMISATLLEIIAHLSPALNQTPIQIITNKEVVWFLSTTSIPAF